VNVRRALPAERRDAKLPLSMQSHFLRGTDQMSNRERIDAWWENPETVSLLDKNLRQLETGFVTSHLSQNDDFADFGCGDGESTIEYAARVKSCLALERSQTLRSRAQQRFREAALKNVELVEGDVRDLGKYHGRFTACVTQRVIINFMSWEEQQHILQSIWATLRPGGRYIMIENTFEGFEALNSVRRAAGLPNIILHDWHNYFLHYDLFVRFLEGRFVIEKHHTFNLYYLLTRVFTNMFAKFEGFGSNAKKDGIFESADKAARQLYELIGDRVHIDVNKGESFGPIQGWVLRRMG
jgi:SAM-dependent methyltransferase